MRGSRPTATDTQTKPDPDYQLETAEGALARAENWKQATAAEFLANGELDDNPRAILFCRQLPVQTAVGWGFELQPHPVERPIYLPSQVEHLIAGPERCETLCRLVRAMAKESDSPGVIFMMEAWVVFGREITGAVKDQLDRRECLYVMLEHRKIGRRIWVAEILRRPTRLKPWLDHPYPAAQQGRISGLIRGLPTEN